MRPSLRYSLPLTLLVLAVAAVLGAAAAGAAEIRVDATGDAADRTAGDGVCGTEENVCTLRAAIETANEAPELDTITFTTQTGAKIAPTRPLPEIVRPVHVLAQTLDGVPTVELDGSALAPIMEQPPQGSFWVRGPHGIRVRGTRDVTIRGLIVHSFPGAQISVADVRTLTLQGNWLGLGADGVSDRGRQLEGPVDSAGLVATSVEQGMIGGGLPSMANVVAGVERGILVDGASAFVEVRGNRVGLSADGTLPVGVDHEGIAIIPTTGAGSPSRVTVAGNTVAATGYGSDPRGGGDAMRITAADTRVLDNRIGFDGQGRLVRSAAGARFGNRANGIVVGNAQRTEVRGNRVAASGVDGIAAGGAALDGLVVAGNVSGLDADASSDADELGAPTGNGDAGIFLFGGRNVEIGGATPADVNVVASNRVGIQVTGPAAAPRIRGNVVGTDRDGTEQFRDATHGITLEANAGAGPVGAEVSGNRVGGEMRNAIALFAGRDHVVRGNVVGVGPTGTPLLGGNGIAVYDVPGVVVGGPERAHANTVASMVGAGIVVAGSRASGTRVEGNRVGFDEHGGGRPEYDATVGILVEDHVGGAGAPDGVRIGGAQAGSGNVVGNSRVGIKVDGPVTNTTLLRNVVGVAPAGDRAPNGTGVVVAGAPGTVIGAPDAGNTIAASSDGGVRISGRGEGRRVQSNQIGMPPLDGQSLENGDYGVRLDEAFDVLVGVPVDRVLSSDCSSGECNVFGPNDGPAIEIEGNGTRNLLRGNRFTRLSEQAIDLGADGRSPIDERDLDEGPNRRLNAPAGVQEAVDPRSGRHYVTGVLESSEPEAVAIEVYGQGLDGEAGTNATLLGSVRADRRGVFRFPLPDGRRFARYTALTQSEFGTSEFSRGCGYFAGIVGDGDADGVCDEWEERGLDYDQDGEVDLRLPGTSDRKDLYVELDAMDPVDGRQDPRPAPAALKAVAAAFAQAPDGGVALHWMGSRPGRELDERVEAVPALDAARQRPGDADDLGDYRDGDLAAPCDGTFGTAADRDDADQRCFARIGARGLAVRYVLSGYELSSAGTRLKGAAPDDRMVALGLASLTDAELRATAAGAPGCLTARGCFTSELPHLLMHELGHTLGLEHGGAASEPASNPAHLSVMSRTYDAAGDLNPLDYARSDGLTLDESAISEQQPYTISDADRARGWRPVLTALRRAGCGEIVVAPGVMRNLDDDPFLTTSIVHGVNDPGGESCLRPFPGRRDVLRGSEEWSKLRFSPLLGARDFGGDAARGAAATAERSDVLDPADLTADRDDDGVPVAVDVCPGRGDAGQADADRDGVGDACVADYAPSDLEVALEAPRRLAVGEEAEVVVRTREAWPLATGSATVAVELGPQLTLAGHDGDGAYDAGAGRWTTGPFGGHETRALRLRVRATGAAGTQAPIAAEVIAAAAADADSTPGDGDPDADDQAQRTVELIPGGADPQLDLDDARVREGTRTRQTLAFGIDLNRTARGSVTLRARTADGTAVGGEDYEPVDARITIRAGSGGAVVRVPVRMDGRDEPQETLSLTVSEVDGASAGRVTATGTIVDDDRPLRAGELATFGCIAKPSLRDRCALDTVGFNFDATALAFAGGGEHLYVADGVSLVHLRRDPRTETLTPGRCWRVRTEGGGNVESTGCEELGRVDTGAGRAYPVADAAIARVVASPDGRRLYALLHAGAAAGGGTAVAAFAVDPASGALRLERCVGDPAAGPACDGGSAEAGGNWSALAVAPGGRQLYVVRDDGVRLVGLDAEGLPTAFRCAGTGAQPAGGGCDPLLEPSSHVGAEVSPDGSTLAVRGDGRVTTFAVDSESGVLRDRRQLAIDVHTLTWAPDSGLLYVAGSDEVTWVDAATLTVRGCVAGESGGATECATRAPVPLAYPGAIRVAPDGRDVYVAVGGGGVVALRRGEDGALSGGRCGEPETDDGPCGDGNTPPFFSRTSSLLIDPAGTTVLASGGNVVNRYLRVQPPAPEGNRPPLCADASASTQPGRTTSLRLPCADLDGDPVTVRVTAPPRNGVLGALDAASATVPYTPGAGFRGADALRFRGNDGRADSEEATVRVTTGNDAPVCEAGSEAPRTRPGRSVELALRCTDADGDPLAIEVVERPREGALDGLRYTARAGWTGVDTLRLRAHDGFDGSAPVELRVTVADEPPTCDGATTAPLAVRAGGTAERFVNCSDPDGGPVTVTLVQQTRKWGSATLSDGVLRYRARTDAGVDTLTLRVADEDGRVADVTVAVHVSPLERPGGVITGGGARGGRSGGGGRPCTGSSCQPDSGGGMTFRYFCGGREVRGPGTCSADLVIIACDRSGCRPTRNQGPGGGAAAARAKPGILPGVRGRRLAQGRATTRAGQSGSVRVRLTRAALRELNRRRRMRVLVVQRVRQPGGAVKTTRRVVTLVAPPRAARRPVARR